MEIFFKKSGKRGRPAKMVRADDGTEVSFKEFQAANKAQKAKPVAPVAVAAEATPVA